MIAPRLPLIRSSTASVSFRGATFAGTPPAPFDSQELMNTFRVPFEVRDIVVTVDATPVIPTIANVAPFIFIEGRFGQHYITDGHVPISLLAPYKVASEVGLFPTSMVEIGPGGLYEFFATRRIHLPKPIVVPPGMGFVFNVRIPQQELLTKAIADGVGDWDANVYLSLVGRTLDARDPIPKTNVLPFISHTILSQTTPRSIETNLRNPLTKPIDVKHFIGVRVAEDVSGFPATAETSVGNGTTISLRFPDTSLASESPADVIGAEFGQMRIWPSRFAMPENSRIIATLSPNAAEATGTVYEIGLFGTREEAI